MSDTLSPLTVGSVFADAIERVAPGIVTVHGRDRVPATGTVIRLSDSTTAVVTASHVVEREDNLAVVDATGTEYSATLSGRDMNRDLAVLHIEDGGLEGVSLFDGTPRVGTLAMAVGRPIERSIQASFGAISFVGSFGMRAGKTCQIILSEAVLYPGFSGGPLISSAGEVIGINSSGERQSGRFTIPVAQVQRVVKDIQELGYVRLPWVGVSVQQVDLPPHVREALPDQETGLQVLAVEQGSPAATGGVEMGDMLVSMDGSPLTDVPDLQQPLCEGFIGQPLSIVAWRGTERHELTVTPTVRPEQPRS